jgi:hypothetical protein
MWPVLFALFSAACSRPVDGAQAGQHRVPFKEGENAARDSHPDGASTEKNDGLRPDSGLPFGDSQTLPAGTLLSVRLTNPIATDNPSFSGVFDAVLDEAILAEGDVLLPRGASVAGRVESARASGLRRNRSYLRLTLDSVKVGNRELPIQTSSLFVRAVAAAAVFGSGSSPQVVRLESGRRLTFRLSEPFSMANPLATSVH